MELRREISPLLLKGTWKTTSQVDEGTEARERSWFSQRSQVKMVEVSAFRRWQSTTKNRWLFAGRTGPTTAST